MSKITLDNINDLLISTLSGDTMQELCREYITRNNEINVAFLFKKGEISICVLDSAGKKMGRDNLLLVATNLTCVAMQMNMEELFDTLSNRQLGIEEEKK